LDDPPSADKATEAYARCKKNGWIDYFIAAGRDYSFAPELLMGIAYRESGLLEKYLEIAGDHGHGYGLMQIDIRSYRAWVDTGKWKDAESCINKGAAVLDSKRSDILALVRKKNIKVRTLGGKSYTFDGKPISGDELIRVSVAAYNCGRWAYYHFSKGHDIDRGTTGQDYSRDVLKRAARFKALLNPETTGATDLLTTGNFA